MKIVAVLGAGHMGTPIARRLIDAGHQVTIWNRSRPRAEPLAADGAAVAESPALAVAGADLVIVMVTDAAAVEAVLFGPDGAAAALRPGAIVVQMSTIGPDEVRAIAGRFPAGVSFLDAPVGGSVNAVQAGTLAIFAGDSPDVVDAAAAVLESLGTIRHCGPIGSGAAVKLVANTGLVTAVAGLHDALEVAASLGVDRQTALDILRRGPLATAVERVGASGSSFAVALAAKDARLALRGTSTTPALAAALELLDAVADPSAELSTVIKGN